MFNVADLHLTQGDQMFNVESLNLKTHWKPRGDMLLVLPFVKAGTYSILDAGENREQPEKGVVLAVGPGGVGPETGRPVPIVSRVGDPVCFGKYAGNNWEIPGPEGDRRPVKVFIMRDSEVMMAGEDVELEIHDGDPRKIHEKGLICEYCPRVDGEAGVERLRLIAQGLNPDDTPGPAPEPTDEKVSAIEEERERLRQARERDASEPASVKG